MSNVTPLNPPKVQTTADEMLEMLDKLAADIRAGTVSPSYLILGHGQLAPDQGEDAESYSWNTLGFSRRELIGHLMSFVTILSSEG